MSFEPTYPDGKIRYIKWGKGDQSIKTLGNVKYNIDLDNTFTVEFTVDEKQISIDVGPRTDVGAS